MTSAQISRRTADSNADEPLIVQFGAHLAEALADVLVEGPVSFDFSGAIARPHLTAFARWAGRETGTQFEADFTAACKAGETESAALDRALGPAMTHIRAILKTAGESPEADRRLTIQMGGEDERAHLPRIVLALRNRPLLAKAASFGRTTNAMQDENALALALQSLPLGNVEMANLIFVAALNHVATPSRLMTAAVKVAGSDKEDALRRNGLAPMVDALLALAQDQIARIGGQQGVFADTDLACRAVDRFHRLMRPLNAQMELRRGAQWANVVADLTRRMSETIAPRLREIAGDVAQSLRAARDGADRLDSDRILAALSGMYLLATLRDTRESLALNTIFDQIWHETGQSLEILTTRNLDAFRQDPANPVIAGRLDAAIKMSSLRFGAEYGDILIRARDTAAKR